MRWTYGPGCTRDPWGLPSWTEGFLVPRAQPGSSLSQLLDLTLGSSVSWPSTHDGGDAEAPQDLRVWVLGSSPINGVPTSPKAPDPHWCLRGGSGRTQKKERGDLPSACLGSPGNKVRLFKAGYALEILRETGAQRGQNFAQGHTQSLGVGGSA